MIRRCFYLPVFLLCTTACSAYAQPAKNLIYGDPGKMKPWTVRFENGKAVETTGKTPNPWNAKPWHGSTAGVVSVAPDPVTQTPSFGIVNLDGKPSLMLRLWKPIKLQPHRRYHFSITYLTPDAGRGVIKFPKSQIPALELPNSKNEWKQAAATFDAPGSELRIEVHNLAKGAEKGLYLKDIQLLDVGPSETTPESSEPQGDAPPVQPNFDRAAGYYRSLARELDEKGLGGGEFVLGLKGDAAIQRVRKFGAQHDRMQLRPLDLAATPDAPAGADAAFEIDVSRSTAHPWSANWGWRNIRDVGKGDVMLVSLWVRSGGSREANTVSLWANVKGPGKNFATIRGKHSKLAPAPDWTQYWFPIRFNRGADADEWSLEFFCGGPTQVLQFAEPAVIYYGRAVELADLPTTRFDYSYPGREADAPWRAAAARRIEQHRKGDLTVTVVDGRGEPVPDAQVEVELTRHAFKFGSVLHPEARGFKRKNYSDDDLKRSRETFFELFNTATIGGYKWEAWRGLWGKRHNAANTLASTQWAYENGFYVHGHTPIWHAYSSMPFQRQDMLHNPKEQRRVILDWLDALLTMPQVNQQVHSWDAINHPFAFSKVWRDYGEVLKLPHGGKELHLEELAKYQEHTPHAKIFVNEGGVMPRGGFQMGRYLEWVKWLLEQDAPFHGVGFMCHFDMTNLTGPEELYRRLDAFAQAGRDAGRDLSLRVTEFDVSANWNDPEQVAIQADYTRDFLITLFSHPDVDGIIAWGYWQGAMWKKNAAWYNRDWKLRPNGKAYRDLVLDQWRTRESIKTDAQGVASLRGFLGEYRITATVDGKVYERIVDLTPPGSSIQIKTD